MSHECKHRQGVHATTQINGKNVVVHNCELPQIRICTIKDEGLKSRTQQPLQTCEGCPFIEAADAIGVAHPRSPSLWTKAKNYIRALAAHVAAGLPVVTRQVYVARLTICDGCELRVPETWECSDCGCPMDEKATWADVECPLKKWLKAEAAKKGEQKAESSSAPPCGSCGG